MKTSILWVFVLSLVLAVMPTHVFAGEVEYTRMGAITGNGSGDVGPWVGAKGPRVSGRLQGRAVLAQPVQGREAVVQDRPHERGVQGPTLSRADCEIEEKQFLLHERLPDPSQHRVYRGILCRNRSKPEDDERRRQENTSGFSRSVPFPYPKNAIEAMWNVKRPYTGDDAMNHECRRVVSPAGKVKRTMRSALVVAYRREKVVEQARQSGQRFLQDKGRLYVPGGRKGDDLLDLRLHR